MKLAYRGFDKSGKPVSATIEANDQALAVDDLRRKGLYVTEIVEELVAGHRANSAAGQKSGSVRGRAGNRLRHLAMFSRQLHVLVHSGTPLAHALNAIERQTENPAWRGVIGSLRKRVEDGSSLSAAMDDHPGFFDPVCRSLVAAGESSGAMAGMLERLSALARKQLQLRNTILGAMVYPALLMCVGLVVMVTMLIFVVPRFAGMFTTLAVPLPPTTKMLLVLSDVLRGWWWAGLVVLVAGGVAGKIWFTSARGIRWLQGVALATPKVGKLARNLVSARIARLMGVLLQSQVPLIEALTLTGKAAGNGRYSDLIERAQDAVSRGESMSVGFEGSDLINASMYEAIRHGEESGQVGPMLLHVADFLDEENEVLVRSLTSLIEPLILLWMGVVVGFIAISMFLPLFDLTAATQGGAQ